MAIDVNTVSRYPTHFLRAVELITQARTTFNVPSENWPHPTQHSFGIPNDNYYAEIWTDGMDYQPSYWIIEEFGLNKPRIQPFMIFNSNEERSRFNEWDFESFIDASLYYRRDIKWEDKNDLSYYTDTVWPFITLFKNEIRYMNMKLYAFEHASQPRVVFWMCPAFIPEIYRDQKKRKRHTLDSGGGMIV